MDGLNTLEFVLQLRVRKGEKGEEKTCSDILPETEGYVEETKRASTFMINVRTIILSES